MSAYVIVEITTHDQTVIEEYRKLTPATIAAFDGQFVVRGGRTITLEGDWNPERVVVLKFPSVEKAQEWWESDIYATAKALREQAATTKMIIVEGVG
jgi:uncharacterized protein (DUF1330 family)